MTRWVMSLELKSYVKLINNFQSKIKHLSLSTNAKLRSMGMTHQNHPVTDQIQKFGINYQILQSFCF